MPNPSAPFAARRIGIAVVLVLIAVVFAWAQQTTPSPTQHPSQAPQTAPQVARTLPSYEGQNVTSVELAGQPDYDAHALEPLVMQKPNDKFSQAKIDQTVAALKRGGHFQTVEVEVRPDPAGVRVLFVLHPAYYFGVYEFPGAVTHFPYSRLLQVADYPPRGPYTSVDVKNAQSSLETFLQRTGYFQAQVKPVLRIDAVHKLVNVDYHVTLGKKAKFGDVKIEGTTPAETSRLTSRLHSFMARLHSSAIRRGKPYDLKKIQNATQYLEDTLVKEKFLGGQVKLIGAAYDRDTNRADVSFHVTTGPPVDARIEGVHLWGFQKKRLLPIYQENGLDPELIQEGRQNLISYFQQKGYFDTKVTATAQAQPNHETIVYQVSKGPRHRVVDVKLAGNQHLNEKELMPHVTVEQKSWLPWSHGKFSQKLLRTSAKNLERLYQSDGFSTAKVTPQVADKEPNLVVTFRVDEGPQDIVESLNVVGNNRMNQFQLAPRGLQVEPGKPYSTKRVDDDRNHIIARYLESGFLTATFRATASPINGDKHRLSVKYEIYEGPQVQTAQVVTLGRKGTEQWLVNRAADLLPGEVLRQDRLMASENRLYTLGVFDWAEIDPRRTITTQSQEDVLVKVHEAKKNEINYGFGFEVVNRGGSVPGGTVALPGLPPVGLPAKFKTSEKRFWGPRGSFQYTRKDLFGRAETLNFSVLGARLDQRADATWSNPHFRGTDWQSNVTLSGENYLENPIFSSRQATGGFQFQHPLNPDKTQNIFLRYDLKETGLSHLLLPDLVPSSDRHVRLSELSANYIRDTRDNVLDAHRGIYETAEWNLNPRFLGSNFSFSKLLTQLAYYHGLPKKIVWANSLRLGFENPFGGSHVPLSERFFSGGGSTLRGFSLNGAGPQQSVLIATTGNAASCNPSTGAGCSQIKVPVGGRQLFILNSEFRIPIDHVKKGLGIATFYDGGNVFQQVGFGHNFWSNYSNTVGIGLRYATPVGPIRIDIGHNLNPINGVKSNTQFFLTLGQAF
jgi:outer membrane protein insertion porin family